MGIFDEKTPHGHALKWIAQRAVTLTNVGMQEADCTNSISDTRHMQTPVKARDIMLSLCFKDVGRSPYIQNASHACHLCPSQSFSPTHIAGTLHIAFKQVVSGRRGWAPCSCLPDGYGRVEADREREERLGIPEHVGVATQSSSRLRAGGEAAHLVLVFLGDVGVLGVRGSGHRDEAVGGGAERGCGGRPRFGLAAAVQQRLAQRLQLLQLGLVYALALILALLIQPVLHGPPGIVSQEGQLEVTALCCRATYTMVSVAQKLCT